MAGHLTLEEREIIAHEHRAGKMQTQIADRLGRSKSTISRELRRNRSRNGYWAVAADRKGISESIQGRMERVGGTANIVSAPGEGTDVELELS